MLMRAPNGAVIDARDEAVKGLIDAGFTRVEQKAEKPAKRKTTAGRRRAATKNQKTE